MARLRLGAIVLQTLPWRETADQFRQIEQVGYDVAYIADHLTHPTMAGRWLADSWTTLAAAAGVTERVDLGTLVASAAIRNPVGMSRAAATIDDISGGRMVLGLGAGTPLDHAAEHGEQPTMRQLSDRFAHVVTALDDVWSGANAHLATRPTAPGRDRPFLLLAGHGPRGFDLVGRYADGWSTYGGPSATQLGSDDFWALLSRQQAEVTAACERHGKDPEGLRRSVLLGYGTVQPLADVASYVQCAERAEEAGFDELVVYWPYAEPGHLLWSDPQVHADAIAALT